VRRLAASVVAPLLLLTTGCFGGDSESEDAKPSPGTIADITVTGGFGEEPVITFKAPISFETTQDKTLVEGSGDGDAVLQDSTVTVDYTAVNASDGNVFSTSWDTEGKATPSIFNVGQVFDGFYAGLQGARAGDRVLLTVASPDAFDPTGNSEQTVRNGDSIVMVVDVKGVDNPTVVPPSRLPAVQLDEDGNPTGFKAKATTPDSVGLLSADVLKTGTGAAVQSDDTLTVRYLGALWPDGATFDSNYTAKKPLVIPLSNTINGWQQGLVGKTVGSRIVLAIPSELAYGSTGSSQGEVTIPPDADLIFVIDIVKAKAAASG
jgi:peptidylprolyl isomerase